jgi:hypothetical protein
LSCNSLINLIVGVGGNTFFFVTVGPKSISKQEKEYEYKYRFTQAAGHIETQHLLKLLVETDLN